jgi:hypothetical protein
MLITPEVREAAHNAQRHVTHGVRVRHAVHDELPPRVRRTRRRQRSGAPPGDDEAIAQPWNTSVGPGPTAAGTIPPMRHHALSAFLWLAGAVAVVVGCNYVHDVLLPPAWRTPFSVAFTLVCFGGFLRVWRTETLRKREAARGHCPRCNYDLTGNVSRVCPECAKAVPG